ncbi:hypothetical protein Clacol_002568 [Clathrus columnatus]|uniref:Uncharacterized protein n=1 Tax=Clathrus columnatus TaxID=1419009 RepID=A0AAV5A163_9AGAM|nr:hypothetical protein Clacol_002568 [Clathrus columnatus]
MLPEESVHQLKEHIKKALTPALDDISAPDLSLVQLLFPSRKISYYWANASELLSTEHLHFLARLPPADPSSSTNPRKRKRESAGVSSHWSKKKHEDDKLSSTDGYLLDSTLRLHKLFKALWGRGSDDSIKEKSSEPVPDIYEKSTDATAIDAIVYDLSKVIGDKPGLLRNRFLVRNEYVEFFKYTTLSTKSKSFLLLGQPGIGKTIYLTYHLVQRLLAGQATIFSFNFYERYLFHQSGVYDVAGDSVRTLWKINPELNEEPPLVLIDFNERQTQWDINVFGSNLILAASSPNRSRYKNWLKESSAVPYVMKTWEWKGIFQAWKFVSAEYNYETDELRDCFLKYGGCARLLLDQTPAEIELQIARAIKSCPDIRKLVGKQNDIPEEESSTLIRIEPDVKIDGSVDRKFMYCEVTSQYIFNQFMRAGTPINYCGDIS